MLDTLTKVVPLIATAFAVFCHFIKYLSFSTVDRLLLMKKEEQIKAKICFMFFFFIILMYLGFALLFVLPDFSILPYDFSLQVWLILWLILFIVVVIIPFFLDFLFAGFTKNASPKTRKIMFFIYVIFFLAGTVLATQISTEYAINNINETIHSTTSVNNDSSNDGHSDDINVEATQNEDTKCTEFDVDNTNESTEKIFPVDKKIIVFGIMETVLTLMMIWAIWGIGGFTFEHHLKINISGKKFYIYRKISENIVLCGEEENENKNEKFILIPYTALSSELSKKDSLTFITKAKTESETETKMETETKTEK